MIKISKEEFATRVENLKIWMRTDKVDVCFVYGDEYRRENLRYLSNNWPIFERGAILVPLTGEPIILGAPEGEMLCREMSAWDDIRLVPDFTCVTVPDEIEYPFAHYTTFENVFLEIKEKTKLKRVGIAGIDAMSTYLFENIKKSIDDAEIVDANDILLSLRLIKSDSEVKCLQKAAEIADFAYSVMMKAVRPGVTELELAGLAIGEVMKQGAEHAPFCLVSSGERVNTIIGRATNKVIQDGDMVMATLAVQYEGYIATFGFPFVVGHASETQKVFITYLIDAYESAIIYLKAGNAQSILVSAVKEYFKNHELSEYDLYPPLHGCGLSEAESPYPNEHTESIFLENMTVNTDISIFGHKYGSNRIESAFVVKKDGYIPMSKLIVKLITAWKAIQDYHSALD